MTEKKHNLANASPTITVLQSIGESVHKHEWDIGLSTEVISLVLAIKDGLSAAGELGLCVTRGVSRRDCLNPIYIIGIYSEVRIYAGEDGEVNDIQVEVNRYRPTLLEGVYEGLLFQFEEWGSEWHLAAIPEWSRRKAESIPLRITRLADVEALEDKSLAEFIIQIKDHAALDLKPKLLP